MKALIVLAGLILAQSSQAGWRQDAWATLKEYNYACKSVEVNIDSIEKNEWITGHVKGLPEDALEKFKMIFYVKTNRWYIHPFAGAGEGETYAKLNENGEFKIRTVKRNVSATKLVAVLVPIPVKIKPQRLWLKPLLGIFGGILKFSCASTLVDGNGDFLH